MEKKKSSEEKKKTGPKSDSAYNFFVKSYMKSQPGETLTTVAARWKETSEEEKQKYKDMAAAAKAALASPTRSPTRDEALEEGEVPKEKKPRI
jgi:hypothetical protein